MNPVTQEFVDQFQRLYDNAQKGSTYEHWALTEFLIKNTETLLTLAQNSLRQQEPATTAKPNNYANIISEWEEGNIKPTQ